MHAAFSMTNAFATLRMSTGFLGYGNKNPLE